MTSVPELTKKLRVIAGGVTDGGTVVHGVAVGDEVAGPHNHHTAGKGPPPSGTATCAGIVPSRVRISTVLVCVGGSSGRGVGV